MKQYTEDSWSQNSNLTLLSNGMIEPLPWIGIGESRKKKKRLRR